MKTKDKDASLRTLTGCLSKGDDAGDTSSLPQKENTWEIKSKTVKLAGHVGHTVTISGRVQHPDMHARRKSEGNRLIQMRGTWPPGRDGRRYGFGLLQEVALQPLQPTRRPFRTRGRLSPL